MAIIVRGADRIISTNTISLISIRYYLFLSFEHQPDTSGMVDMLIVNEGVRIPNV